MVGAQVCVAYKYTRACSAALFSATDVKKKYRIARIRLDRLQFPAFREGTSTSRCMRTEGGTQLWKQVFDDSRFLYVFGRVINA